MSVYTYINSSCRVKTFRSDLYFLMIRVMHSYFFVETLIYFRFKSTLQNVTPHTHYKNYTIREINATTETNHTNYFSDLVNKNRDT